MTDPRIALGYEVEPDVEGPYELAAACDTGGDAGGTLDVGIMARRVSDGERIVIGEIWAACPNRDQEGKTRIDAAAVASRIVDVLNTLEKQSEDH